MVMLCFSINSYLTLQTKVILYHSLKIMELVTAKLFVEVLNVLLSSEEDLDIDIDSYFFLSLTDVFCNTLTLRHVLTKVMALSHRLRKTTALVS